MLQFNPGFFVFASEQQALCFRTVISAG